jgi:hypothetical protein
MLLEVDSLRGLCTEQPLLLLDTYKKGSLGNLEAECLLVCAQFSPQINTVLEP